jgi:integrase
MAKGRWTGTWPGGRIWTSADGTTTYVIRRKVAGRPYEVSTRCTSLRAAMAQLARFEADPEGYDPSGGQGERLLLDVDRAKAFLLWSLNEKGNSADWVRQQKRYLAWWMERLGGMDLRRVTLRQHILPALDGVTGRRHRIEVIKAFYSWMRKERALLTAAQDPTYGALAVPQLRPEQWRRPKAFPRSSHESVVRHLAGPWPDLLVVLAGTGWHVTEVNRFARAGIVAELPSSASRAHGAAAVLVCPRRKSGEEQRTPVSSDVADAARRVRKRGGFSVVRLYKAVTAACLAAEVEPYSPGQYRHSVATWAIEQGADPAAVAAFLGHKSPSTTRRFYATLAVTPKVPTLA